jgi:hypothetical protein
MTTARTMTAIDATGRARAAKPRRGGVDAGLVRGLVLLLVAAGTLPVHAADWTFGGHAKYQYTHTDHRTGALAAALADDPAQDDALELRLRAEGAQGPWEAGAHYEVLALQGDSAAARALPPPFDALAPARVTAAGLPDDRRRLLDLTDTLSDDARRFAVHRLDRLYLGWRRGALALRLGRQALSWGGGLVFHPLDFINPFAPLAIDKDYKTGDDMLYAQYVLAEGGDVQAVVLPRRDPGTGELEGAQSTYAAKLRTYLGEADIDLLAARHFDETLAGLGLARGLGGAVWRLDLLYTDASEGEGVWSLVSNLDYSWVWRGRNWYGFVEYFRNGFGAGDPASYAAPDPALAARLARGELFTLARDYGAAGAQVELHPLFNLYASVVWNLDDSSRFLQLRGVYDWRQDVQLQAGINLPRGDPGEEYGSIALPGTGALLAPARSFYLRAALYF